MQWLYKVVLVLVVVILLGTVLLLMLRQVYAFSEEQALERLHLETRQIKEEINLQMLSDRENLQTMAGFAAELYDRGESFELMFEAYESTGLFANIGILLPDDTFLTKRGILKPHEDFVFTEELQRGEYISGRVRDVTDPEREVVRSAVPILAEDGTAVGILYGLINLKDMEERYAVEAESRDAYLCVVEGTNGNFLLDTRRYAAGMGGEKLENVSLLEDYEFQGDVSYEQLRQDLMESTPGFASFFSGKTGELLYVHYAPMAFEDWQIMLMQSEKVVFAGAEATSNFIGWVCLLIILIMMAYVILVFLSDRKLLLISNCASGIRKNLLDMDRKSDKIRDGLKSIVRFTGARSAFIVDAHGEYHYYTDPNQKNRLFFNETEVAISNNVLAYAQNHRLDQEETLYLSILMVNRRLRRELPDFYELLKSRGVRRASIAVISGGEHNNYILGIINPRRQGTRRLLREIAVCFTMAIRSKNHLTLTETLALTDSMTGLANRLAYQRDVELMSVEATSMLTCIYVDVNELHYFNNKHGHLAGDRMLIYIAEMLKKEFSDSRVYRMGGDEFLVFTQWLPQDTINARVSAVRASIEKMEYHISLGIAVNEDGLSVEELVSTAEKQMYDEKAQYYQNKELSKVMELTNHGTKIAESGIREIDACMAVMSMRYAGVFCVSLKNDSCLQVVSPSYFARLMDEFGSFPVALRKYIHDFVRPEHQRQLLTLLDYDALERQLRGGKNPNVYFVKIDGSRMRLNIHLVSEPDSDEIDTVWIMEKEEWAMEPEG